MLPDELNWLRYFAGSWKSHRENSISFIFLEFPHQVEMKNVVKSSKHFLGYFKLTVLINRQNRKSPWNLNIQNFDRKLPVYRSTENHVSTFLPVYKMPSVLLHGEAATSSGIIKKYHICKTYTCRKYLKN